jgi:LysM repeat protein
VANKAEMTSPVAQASPTPIRMLAIMTPTPPGQGAAPATDPTPAPPTEAQPNAAPTQPAANPGNYVIKQGDTLYAIAVQYKVSIQALMEANSITDPTSIQAGQVLVIPTSSTP